MNNWSHPTVVLCSTILIHWMTRNCRFFIIKSKLISFLKKKNVLIINHVVSPAQNIHGKCMCMQNWEYRSPPPPHLHVLIMGFLFFDLKDLLGQVGEKFSSPGYWKWWRRPLYVTFHKVLIYTKIPFLKRCHSIIKAVKEYLELQRFYWATSHDANFWQVCTCKKYVHDLTDAQMFALGDVALWNLLNSEHSLVS